MRCDVLPHEFDPIANLVSFVQKKSSNEYSSSCPQCGDSGHKGSDAPDRFVLFRISRYGFPLGFCRVCGYRWTQKGKEPTKEQLDEWRREQIEVEKSRIEAAKRSLELLQNDRVWEQFFIQNNDWSREIYKEWGISPEWVDYLRLGLMPDYLVKVKNGGETYHSPAATIPVWNVGGVVQNIKLRVLNPKSGADRYRNFYAMGQSFLFVPLYDLPLSGAGVLVEGEKKSIVLEQKLDNPRFRVVGLQSKNPDATIFDQLKDLEPIFLWLDPDAKKKVGDESAVERVARMLRKERVRIVDCPIKCDDGIVKFDLNPWAYIKMARKA